MDWRLFDTVIERIANGAGRLRELVPLIVAEPRAYPREAMLLASIAALCLILLVLLAMTAGDAVGAVLERRRMGVRVRVRARVMRAMVVVALAVSASCVVLVLPKHPAAGSACGACHAVRGMVASWEQGTHADVACYGCHARPGFIGALEAGMAGVGRRLARRASAPSTFSTSCTSCHDDLAVRIVGDAVRMRHADVIEAGLECTACHVRVGHEGNGKAQPFRPVMSRCLVCHDGIAAAAECTVCHVEPPLDRASTPPAAAAVARGGCTECHSPRTRQACVDCHGLELPHPITFMRRHAALSDADPALCARCHETASAERACACHASDVNLHGTYERWFREHGPLAAVNGPGGCLCHNEANFRVCAACHERYPWE